MNFPRVPFTTIATVWVRLFTGLWAVTFLGQLTANSLSAADVSGKDWSPQSAAKYLDQRMSWWMNWPKAARDHQTFCISCHTALPYALSRSALRDLPNVEPSPTVEQDLFANVVKRVQMWSKVEPFYTDQNSGPQKTSESRSTESVLNALILVWRDRPAGKLSGDARLALENMWRLQFRGGEMDGTWAWLQFHNAPWEGDSQFWGVSLAAIAVGSAPGNYKAEPAIQPGLKRMRVWLQREMDRQTPLDRVALLWASAKLPTLLSSDQQKTILRETLSKQRDDGSFSTSDLIGAWKRKDGTPLHSDSDGYATGLVAFALEQLGTPETKSNVDRAVTWLRKNQNAEEGRWPAYSLNKERELISDAGRFMSDAATAYAVLAIANVK